MYIKLIWKLFQHLDGVHTDGKINIKNHIERCYKCNPNMVQFWPARMNLQKAHVSRQFFFQSEMKPEHLLVETSSLSKILTKVLLNEMKDHIDSQNPKQPKWIKINRPVCMGAWTGLSYMHNSLWTAKQSLKFLLLTLFGIELELLYRSKSAIFLK